MNEDLVCSVSYSVPSACTPHTLAPGVLAEHSLCRLPHQSTWQPCEVAYSFTVKAEGRPSHAARKALPATCRS